MAFNQPTNPPRTEPKLGGRIDIVEDEDFALLLDGGAEGGQRAASGAPVPASSSAAVDAGQAVEEEGVSASAAGEEIAKLVPAPATTPIMDLTPPDSRAEPVSAREVIDVPDEHITLTPAPLRAAAATASAGAAAQAAASGAAAPAPSAGTAAPTASAGTAAPTASAPAAAAELPPPAAAVPPSRDGLNLPLIGHHAQPKQIRILLTLLGVSILLGALLVWINFVYADMASTQTQVAGDALMHSQRIGKAAPNAMQGNAEAFRQLEESRKEFSRDLEQLSKGGSYQGLTLSPPSSAIDAQLKESRKLWERSDRAAETILKYKKELTSFGATLQRLNGITPALLDLTEQIAGMKVQGSAGARDISAASQLSMLTQRMARNANDLLSAEGVNPETAYLLGKDVNTFRDIVDGFLRGSDTLRLAATKEGEVRERLHKLQSTFDEYRQLVGGVLDNKQKFIAAKQSEQLIFVENEQIKKNLSTLQQSYRAEQDSLHWSFWLLLAAFLVALASAAGIAVLLLEDSRHRAEEAEDRRVEAERQRAESERHEAEIKSVHDKTQAAILRLMNELQAVADGDLTAQATVSEDMTGAIADSINYTLEELRALVERVTTTAEMVTAASNQAQSTSNSLLAASHQQSRDIQETGQAVMAMAVQITDVSRAAIESAEVAQLSVAAAAEGATAVGNAILGMKEIREQIQETSKRIKRLGESSQEIGEITELISDITEQTNVLALNAAIQAASAGEAGRGFSIVAEEVQRLAERSGQATKQIGALVRTIQTDTHDAVAAMERSTHGVVEGARLSDAAGTALADIRRVSNRLAELIQGISSATEQQATSANGVAQSIQHILNVTEKTQEGTQHTAQSIRELARLAQELKDSVSRFRISA